MQAQSIADPTVSLTAAYWSLTIVSTVGFDVLPYTNAERVVMLLAQLAGVLFFNCAWLCHQLAASEFSSDHVLASVIPDK